MSETINLTATNASLALSGSSPLPVLTSGMQNHVLCHFAFGTAWSDLSKVAVFRAGDKHRSISREYWLDDSTVAIPPEILSASGYRVHVGLYGYSGTPDNIIIPTVECCIGTVLKGSDPSEDAPAEQTIPLWVQTRETLENEIAEKVNAKQDALTAGANITIENNVISAGGTLDHRQLTNRDAAGQHPIGAISGSGSSNTNPRTGDFFMGGHAIHNVADANPNNNLDAVNVQFMKRNIPQAGTAYFGGIKAAARDASTDTQEVKIDTASGKLYVPQSSGTQEVFYAAYNITTYAELLAAYDAGKAIVLLYTGSDGQPAQYVFTGFASFPYGSESPTQIRAFFSNEYDSLVTNVVAVFGAEEPHAKIVWIKQGFYEERTSRKVQNITANELASTNYPSEQAVIDYVDNAISAAIGNLPSILSEFDAIIGGDEP